MSNKYLITLWKKNFDYDGLGENFKILGQYDDLVEALMDFPLLAERVIADGLNEGTRQNAVWEEFEINYAQLNSEYRDFYAPLFTGIPEDVLNCLDFVEYFFHKVNRYNKVLGTIFRAIRNRALPDWEKKYYSLQIVELPADTPITAELFNLKGCQMAVESYFSKN